MEREHLVESCRSYTISVADSAIESVRDSEVVRRGLRLYDGGCIGVAGAQGPVDEGALEAMALQNLGLATPYDCELSSGRREHVVVSSELTDERHLIEEMETILTELRARQSDFCFSNTVRTTEVCRELRNERGLELRYEGSNLSFELLFKERDSGSIFDGLILYRGRRYNQGTLLSHIHEICDAYRNVVSLPRGKRLPVVFDARIAGGFDRPLGFFSRALHGQSFARGASLLSPWHGKQAFSEDFTLAQSRSPERDLLAFFDDEGVVNDDYRYVFIDRGVVVTPYTDKRTARAHALPATGSAAAEYDGVPAVSYPHMRVLEGRTTMRELLGGKPAIYALVAMGGDYTPKGDYAAPVQLGLLFDGERFIGRVPGIHVWGNVFDMFGSGFIGCGSDPFPLFSENHLIALDLEVSAL